METKKDQLANLIQVLPGVWSEGVDTDVIYVESTDSDTLMKLTLPIPPDPDSLLTIEDGRGGTIHLDGVQFSALGALSDLVTQGAAKVETIRALNTLWGNP